MMNTTSPNSYFELLMARDFPAASRDERERPMPEVYWAIALLLRFMESFSKGSKDIKFVEEEEFQFIDRRFAANKGISHPQQGRN